MSPEDYMLPCLNKQILGFECTGCGMQRALTMIYHGDFIAAFQMYPAIYTLILFFAFIGINAFLHFKFANKIIVILALTNVVVIIGSYLIKII